MKKPLVLFFLSLACTFASGQDSLAVLPQDSALRIVDLSPYFTLHVDSTLNYALQINKDPQSYFWYLKNAPVGLRINKDNGLIVFKADKSYFLSGKLKYDVNYKVLVGVQNRSDPTERIDTSFTIVFYNTEIIASRVKPSVSPVMNVDEGDEVSFLVFCENGSFPIENIITLTNAPIAKYGLVQQCGDEFSWTPPYEFVKETDPNGERSVLLQFIGTTRFGARDTATVRLAVRNALDYPLAAEEHRQVVKNINRYVLELKYTFLQLDKKLKRNRSARTTFDLTSATTSLTGTIMSTSGNENAQRNGKILPSVGLALVPIKEASVPSKVVDQNQAALIRTAIKRLEYMIEDNALLGDRDPDIVRKTNKLKEELKQTKVQLIEVPTEITGSISEEELNRYWNSSKVQKKYRLKSR